MRIVKEKRVPNNDMLMLNEREMNLSYIKVLLSLLNLK